MKILIYGLNYPPEITGIGKYSGEMAEWLVGNGHEVRVICAPPYYPEWRIDEKYRGFGVKKEWLNNVCVMRSPLYVPRSPNTLTRLLHLFSFSVSSFFLVMSQVFWRPDVVITVVPTFFCTTASLLLAELTGAKSLLHVQDFELDAMLGLGMGRFGSQGKLAETAYWLERNIMKRFSAVSSISNSMLNQAANKLKDTSRLILFPNWVDVDFVSPDADGAYFREQWGIPAGTKVVLYSGNLGKKQGLEMVLQTAAVYQQRAEEVMFVFVGSGAAEKDLKRQLRELGLNNTQFYPLQPYERLPELMALADVHLVIQKKGVANAVLPSKLTTILSAGGWALITAEKDTELGFLCEHFPFVAKRVEPENLPAFVDALTGLLQSINVHQRRHNQNAREYAERYLSKQSVLQGFERSLVGL